MDKNDIKRTMHYGESAIGLLKRGTVPPYPQYYELLYTYVTGVNVTLNKRLNELFSRGQEVNIDTIDELCSEFIGSQRREDWLNIVSKEISTSIDAVHEAIDNAAANANSYSGLLQTASGDLSAGLGSDSLKGVTEGLLSETRKMQTANATLEDMLLSAQTDISALRSEIDEVRRESMRDALTTINNRKTFDQDIRQAVTRAVTNAEPLSLLLIDIDHFKVFNDDFGHQIGDQVLRLVATTLRSALGDGNLAARYGGEEFAAILPASDLHEATDIAEAVRKAVHSKQLLKRSTNEKLGRVTVSVGIATFRDGDNVASLIARADKCLYGAKHSGRNNVMNEDRFAAQHNSETNNFAA